MTDGSCFDVIVVGGGPVGATLATALAAVGVRAALVDAAPEGAPPDIRAYAVAAGAFTAWAALGVEGLEAVSQPVRGMAVSDGPAAGASASAWALRSAIRFDAADVDFGDAPFAWLVEDAHLRPALRRAADGAGVTWLAGARLRGLEADGREARATLEDGRTLYAPLVVGAEGRRSAVREAAGIGEQGWGYRQEGVVAAVALDQPHGSVARQLFFPTGPLAVLPLTGERASLVWSTSPEQARALVEAPAEAFEAAVVRAAGDAVGGVRLLGGRARLPLQLRLAQTMTAPRVALAGDAAQTIHPVAGQGLNLGLKDAAALAETIVEARRVGEDIGAPAVLERYARWRRLDRLTLAAGTDAFVRLFSTEAPLARLARSAAFAAAGGSRGLRGAFMREAAGLSGEPPRLFRGLPL